MTTYYNTIYPSPLGKITLASQDGKLIGLWMEGQKYHGNTLFPKMVEKDDEPIFNAAKRWLDRYFAGENPAIKELPLAPVGSEFRRQVWNILCEIPYGEIITYGDISKEIASLRGKSSMSSQAVGGAVGHNPISIIIPCHRVVGSNGSLTGYAGGIAIKIELLKREGVNMDSLFIPSKGTAL